MFCCHEIIDDGMGFHDLVRGVAVIHLVVADRRPFTAGLGDNVSYRFSRMITKMRVERKKMLQIWNDLLVAFPGL